MNTLKDALAFHSTYVNVVRDSIETYEDFIDYIYLAIDRTISELEENNAIHISKYNPIKDTKELEDAITLQIKSMLRMAGMDANHDAYHRGHCDLIVRHGPFSWIAEAKLGNGASYIYGGYLQLSSRYTTGKSKEKNTAILIYTYNLNVNEQMNKWHSHLSQLSPPKNTQWLEDSKFETVHPHISSGSEIVIRHIPILFSYSPEK